MLKVIHNEEQKNQDGLRDHFRDILNIWQVTVPTILDIYYGKFRLSVHF